MNRMAAALLMFSILVVSVTLEPVFSLGADLLNNPQAEIDFLKEQLKIREAQFIAQEKQIGHLKEALGQLEDARQQTYFALMKAEQIIRNWEKIYSLMKESVKAVGDDNQSTRVGGWLSAMCRQEGLELKDFNVSVGLPKSLQVSLSCARATR